MTHESATTLSLSNSNSSRMPFEATHLHQFTKHFDVQCPRCAKKAIVQDFVDTTQILHIRVSCVHCGYGKNFDSGSHTSYDPPKRFRASNWILFSEPVDVYFRLPLWYQIAFREHTLAAYNLEHLQFLKAYIGDNLRERRPDEQGWSNRSLQSRLPKWMLKAENREEILRKLEQMERI